MIFATNTYQKQKEVGVHISTLVKKLLNVKKIVIEDLRFESQRCGEALIIQARPTSKSQSRCGICGKKSPGYDMGTRGRRWRASDFGSTQVFIESDLPRVCCKEHGVVAAMVPWARHGARFARDFEDTVCWLSLHSSCSVVSSLMRIAWHTVGEIAGRVYDELKGNEPDIFNGLVRIGIDETSYKKGQKYMTVIVNHDTGALIWAAKGIGRKVLDGFFETLTPAQRESIRFVTADGAQWIRDCVARYCPKAERCIDPFHVVQWATDALDEVRKGVWRDARKAEPPKPKRGVGRPKKGTEDPPSQASSLKGARFALLKNPENLTDKQEAQLEMIATADPRLYRAYLLKERLRLIFKLTPETARQELDAWIKSAQRCRLPRFVELQRTIRRHYEAILAAINNGLSNARVEAINNKIKLTIRMGYGFRNIDNLIALIMLRCSKLPVILPGRA
jgi:transposase